jgi:N-acetylated-alpha-linked acidic dipeptidase
MSMPARRDLLAAALAFACAGPPAGAAERAAGAIAGYTAASTARQREVESALVALPSPDEARRFHRHLTAEPHPAGSERNNELAFWIAEQWTKQGLEQVTLHRYDVLNTAPRAVALEMVAPVRYRASLTEEPYDVDPDTRNPRVGPAYIGLSASGEITAPVVYAHSGNPEDYDLLARSGVDVRGKIVLVRYSNPYSYRGFKALTAERRGAAALLIYSDPMEDGFAKGKVFPDGPWGPASHVQRGAITYDFIVPGDPLTPGWPSLADARRVAPAEAQSLPKIMALPLSWQDARPLLEHMDGPEAPAEWRGALPIAYRLGGERVKVRLKIDMDNSVKPNYVVEARIRGSELPDEWVVLGNHRDAWVFGGVDPSSGTASLLELSRALGALLKQGLRPRRTLVLCSWDGEEVGLTGSTEWGEHFAGELRSKAVAYLNVDSSASGPDFDGSAVASLAPLLVDVSRTLDDPSGTSLYAAWRAFRERERREARAAGKPQAARPVSDDDLADTRIGSGSDHTVFLNHLGVPTIGLQFDGPYGVYHSMYDDFFWMERFGDPGHRYHALMARLWGVVALRLANADLLPFDFASYARHLRAFVDELPQGAARPDLASLRAEVERFDTAGRAFGEAADAALAAGGPSATAAERVNRGIRQVEANWLHPDGIPGRPWFKHLLYAARYTYAHLELPGLTEAIEAGDAARGRAQAGLVEDALRRNVALLDELRAALAAERPAP